MKRNLPEENSVSNSPRSRWTGGSIAVFSQPFGGGSFDVVIVHCDVEKFVSHKIRFELRLAGRVDITSTDIGPTSIVSQPFLWCEPLPFLPAEFIVVDNSHDPETCYQHTVPAAIVSGQSLQHDFGGVRGLSSVTGRLG